MNYSQFLNMIPEATLTSAVPRAQTVSGSILWYVS